MNDRKPSNKLWRFILLSGVCFLLLLLIGNVVLILLAINVNKYICRSAANSGVVTCANGGNQREIQAEIIRAIYEPAVNSFFMNRPELAELKFYVQEENGVREQMLLLKTVTGVRVPAPFLLFVTSPEQNGFLRFSSTCKVKLKDIR